MMQLIVKPPAAVELLDFNEWFEGQQVELGIKFTNRVSALFARLLHQPRMYHRAPRCPRGREVRVGRAKPFEVLAFYEVTATEIVILSVVHARSKRRSWRQRL